MASIWDFITDKDEQKKFGQSLLDVTNRGIVGGLLGAPVDIATMAMRPFGYSVEKPVLGSEWIGDKMQQAGLVSDNRNPVAETISAFVDPVTLSAAPAKLAAALKGGSVALPAMTVWHGSPHKFSKFDMSKIGTGEGAQAYGHGLYMAENPNIAASYQEKLSKIPLDGGYDSMQRFLTYGKTKPRRVDMNAPSNSLTPAETALSYMHMNKGSAFDASQDIRSMIEMMPPDVDKYKKALKILESGKLKRGLLGEDYGNLYKVDIPDEAVARFLDWDKSLADQAPDVLQSIDGLLKERAAKALKSDQAAGFNRKLSFDEFYQRYLQKKPEGLIKADIGFSNPATASEMLKSYGIPGIKYLDGGSRSTGSGSRNFVLFDDQMPRILEVNGQSTGLQPWKNGEWNGLLGN